nr:carboxypeptidase-like regulatory domain-containing protein [Armatimonadota bacterium]
MRRLEHPTYLRSLVLRGQFCILCLLGMLSLAGRVDAAVFVSGQVVSAAGGAPVAGATISMEKLDSAAPATLPNAGVAKAEPAAPLPLKIVRMQSGLPKIGAPEPVMAHTLGNGSFLVKIPRPGHYALQVDALGFVVFERPVDVPAAGLSALKVELNRPPTLHLKVLAPGGNPVKTGDVHVWLLTASRRETRPAAGTWTTTPATPDGTVEVSTSPNITLADAGAIGLCVRVEGVGVASVFRPEWPSEPVTVQLVSGKSIIGKAVDAAGKPATGVEVYVNGADRDLAHRFLQGRTKIVSGQDGTFQVSDLLPGRYDLAFALPGQGAHYHLLTLETDRTNVTLSEQDRSGIGIEWPQIENRTGRMALTLSGPIAETPSSGIAVSGKIIGSGTPMGGVTIGLYSMHGDGWETTPVDVAVSGTDGTYIFQAPAPGRYEIGTGWNQEGDYNPANREVNVPAGGATEVNLPVERRSKLQLRLVGVDGKPVASGEVHVALQVQSSNQSWGFNPSSNVGPDGLVTVRSYQNIPAATVTGLGLTVRHDTAGWAHLHLDHWTDQLIVLQLQKGVTVEGQVVNSAAAPVKDASLQLYWLNEQDRGFNFENLGEVGVSGASHFALTQLPVGVYRLTATAPGASEQSTIVHVAAEANPFLTIRMVKGQTLTVHVVDPAGQPALNVPIQIYQMNVQNGAYPQFQQMNQGPPAGGVRVVTGLVPGTYFAAAQMQNGQTASQVVTIVPGKDVAIVLRPTPQK